MIERSPVGTVFTEAAKGNEVAFAHLVDVYHEDMLRVCFVVCGDPTMAADGVAAAWAIAWRRLGTVRDPDRLKGWLISVAANETRHLIRSRRRRSLVEIPVAAVPFGLAGSDPADGVAGIDLVTAMGRLRPEDRAILAMRYLAGLSSFEIASLTRMSASGTRARLARLLARLREDLGDG